MEDWRAALELGETSAAWDRFLTRYRRVMFAAIRHYARDYDDVMDIFARACEVLREEDLRRLRAYHAQPEHSARVSTWLVTVVRHITVDWFRQRDGRRRLTVAVQGLPARQRRIFEYVFIDGRSHMEAFELLRTGEAPGLTFREFLADLQATYRGAAAGRRGSLLRTLHPAPAPSAASAPEHAVDESNPVEAAEREALLERALRTLSAEDRVAVQLYVVEEMPAADVARIVGLPNAKAVYNRVYRALAAMRHDMERAGVAFGDL
jgi:DNA-directed RNA polymerase specialized sigma24 family protein